MDNYERLVDDGTVPFPYYTGLKEPNEEKHKMNLIDSMHTKCRLADLVTAKNEYDQKVESFEKATGVEVIGEREGEIVIFLGTDPYTVKSKMKQLASLFEAELYINPDYRAGITRLWFFVGNTKILAVKEAE